MTDLEFAEELAIRAHGEQSDLQGSPYIHHLRRVEMIVEDLTDDPDAHVVAMLHDILEDTLIGSRAIFVMFNINIRAALNAITREKEVETYAHYIERVCEDDIAILVKYADVLDHLENGERVFDMYPTLRGRYLKAMEYIKPILIKKGFEL